MARPSSVGCTPRMACEMLTNVQAAVPVSQLFLPSPKVGAGPVACLAEVGVRSGNEPQRVVVKAAAHSQVALLGQGTDTGRAAAVSILLFLVTVPATALSVYFSALTAYGIHAYDFKLKKPPGALSWR